MKRKNYIISYDGKEVIKHAWNASMREIERIIGNIAREQETVYHLTLRESEKEEGGFDYVKGTRTWEGDNGNKVVFHVQKTV